ncbi:MAG: hypothetical protein QXX55_00045 [Candidatus Pacearchaeota archaeon]
MKEIKKKEKFKKIVEDIKKIKIQGASNVAKSALMAYYLFPSKKSKEILMKSRPTEPMMFRVLNLADKIPREKILKHFEEAQDKINRYSLNIIKNGDIIITHCHSTNVLKALIYAHKKGKKFLVYNTETRPIYQGRKTALELKRAGIKVTMFIDSAIEVMLKNKDNKGDFHTKKIFIGADALLKNGIINKIGSGMIAKIASLHKIPFYIIADSWKFTKKNIPIESRHINEIWDKAPKNIKIKNPAFEFVSKKYISGIVTEFGFMKYNDFIKKVKKYNF